MTAATIDGETDGIGENAGPTVGPWPRRIEHAAGRSLLGRPMDHWRSATRAELGLPVTGTLVVQGHQATFWHPGIAMKVIAADEMARLQGGAMWHLVVDTDAHPVGCCPIPVRDHEGALREGETWLHVAEDATFLRDPFTPTGRRPPIEPPPLDRLPPTALPEADLGLRGIAAALMQEGCATDAAMQITSAMLRLLSPRLAAAPAIIRSSSLLSTSIGQALLDAMRNDPAACVAAYNDAIDRTPGAGASLQPGQTPELPLWRLQPDGQRRHATVEDLRDAPDGSGLLPRALLVTAIVRLAAADLFVHGTGGIAYDRAMVRWLHGWIGASPAPAALATATLRLAVPEAEIPPDAVASAIARWRRLHADPERLLGDGGASTKLDEVAAITAAPRGSRERADRFIAMHRRLDEARRRAANPLDEAQREIGRMRRLAAGRAVARLRTWPFPLHPPSAIAALVDATRRAVSAADRA